MRALVLLAIAACGSTTTPPAPPSNRAEPAVPSPRTGAQYVGNPAADVALVYWFDYECPHCLNVSPVLDAIARAYGDRIVIHYKNFPLPRHTAAREAAIAAEAARRQDRFVDMYHLLVERSPSYGAEDLRHYASVLVLDQAQFEADLHDPSAAGAIDQEVAEGNRKGLQYVPVLYINGAEYTGDLVQSSLSAAIDAALR